MKRTFLFAALLAALACSCEKSQVVETVPEVNAEAELNLSVAVSGHGTKASYTESQAYETKINSVKFFVFDATSGKIDKVFGTSTSTSASISTSLGNKKIWAIANPPEEYDYVSSESDLKAICVNLEDNKVSNSWFVMAGSAEVELVAGGSEVTIDLNRIAARVCLNKVSVNLPPSYESVELQYVYLSNVRSYTNFGQTATGSWVNFQGRKSSDIIDGDTILAENEELTAHKPGETIENFQAYAPQTPLLMYAMPNASKVDPSGYVPGATDLRTVLVAVVKIEGKKYYYPVVLNSAEIKSNVSYSVSMTIASLGSSDPNTPVAKSALDVQINVEPWGAGAEYDEVI